MHGENRKLVSDKIWRESQNTFNIQ